MASRKPFYQQGAYFGTVTSQGLTTSGTGTVQFVLRAKITAYPDDDTHERSEIPAHQRYERTVYMALTDKTMDFVAQNLAAIGFEGDNLALLDPGMEGFHDFKGKEITLWCKHEDYQGQPQEKWAISTGPREVITKEVDPRDLKKLNGLFGKAKRQVNASTPTTSSIQQSRTAAQESDQGITDDDIPF